MHGQNNIKFVCFTVRLSSTAFSRFWILPHSPVQRRLSLPLESTRRFYDVTGLEGCQVVRSYGVPLQYFIVTCFGSFLWSHLQAELLKAENVSVKYINIFS